MHRTARGQRMADLRADRRGPQCGRRARPRRRSAARESRWGTASPRAWGQSEAARCRCVSRPGLQTGVAQCGAHTPFTTRTQAGTGQGQRASRGPARSVTAEDTPSQNPVPGTPRSPNAQPRHLRVRWPRVTTSPSGAPKSHTHNVPEKDGSIPSPLRQTTLDTGFPLGKSKARNPGPGLHREGRGILARPSAL